MKNMLREELEINPNVEYLDSDQVKTTGVETRGRASSRQPRCSMKSVSYAAEAKKIDGCTSAYRKDFYESFVGHVGRTEEGQNKHQDLQTLLDVKSRCANEIAFLDDDDFDAALDEFEMINTLDKSIFDCADSDVLQAGPGQHGVLEEELKDETRTKPRPVMTKLNLLTRQGYGNNTAACMRNVLL